MGLDIDITEKTGPEIIDILETYPRGHLEIKFDRVFWISTQIAPTNRMPQQPGARPPMRPVHTMHNAANRALDALGSMMGPPAR